MRNDIKIHGRPHDTMNISGDWYSIGLSVIVTYWKFKPLSYMVDVEYPALRGSGSARYAYVHIRRNTDTCILYLSSFFHKDTWVTR